MEELKKVAIDNDFLDHLLKIKGSRRNPLDEAALTDLIGRFFVAQELSPVMHSMVYEHEALVFKNAVRDKLTQEGILSIIPLGDILKTKEGGETYYAMMVREIYREFTGKPYPCKNVFQDWKSRMSLGEIHTVVMCAFLHYDCFLSDDSEAAKKLPGIVKRRLNHPISIDTRNACCARLRSRSEVDRQRLTSQELNWLSHTSRC